MRVVLRGWWLANWMAEELRRPIWTWSGLWCRWHAVAFYANQCLTCIFLAFSTSDRYNANDILSGDACCLSLPQSASYVLTLLPLNLIVQGTIRFVRIIRD